MHSIGTLALRRSGSPDPSPAVPSPITVPKRVWPKPTDTTAFVYDPWPSPCSRRDSSSSVHSSFSSSSSSTATNTLRKQPSWTSRPAPIHTMNDTVRMTALDMPGTPKRSNDSEPVRSPGGYDLFSGAFRFDCASDSPKGFYVRSIEEFLGDPIPARRTR